MAMNGMRMTLLLHRTPLVRGGERRDGSAEDLTGEGFGDDAA